MFLLLLTASALRLRNQVPQHLARSDPIQIEDHQVSVQKHVQRDLVTLALSCEQVDLDAAVGENSLEDLLVGDESSTHRIWTNMLLLVDHLHTIADPTPMIVTMEAACSPWTLQLFGHAVTTFGSDALFEAVSAQAPSVFNSSKYLDSAVFGLQLADDPTSWSPAAELHINPFRYKTFSDSMQCNAETLVGKSAPKLCKEEDETQVIIKPIDNMRIDSVVSSIFLLVDSVWSSSELESQSASLQTFGVIPASEGGGWIEFKEDYSEIDDNVFRSVLDESPLVQTTVGSMLATLLTALSDRNVHNTLLSSAHRLLEVDYNFALDVFEDQVTELDDAFSSHMSYADYMNHFGEAIKKAYAQVYVERFGLIHTITKLANLLPEESKTVELVHRFFCHTESVPIDSKLPAGVYTEESCLDQLLTHGEYHYYSPFEHRSVASMLLHHRSRYISFYSNVDDMVAFALGGNMEQLIDAMFVFPSLREAKQQDFLDHLHASKKVTQKNTVQLLAALYLNETKTEPTNAELFYTSLIPSIGDTKAMQGRIAASGILGFAFPFAPAYDKHPSVRVSKITVRSVGQRALLRHPTLGETETVVMQRTGSKYEAMGALGTLCRILNDIWTPPDQPRVEESLACPRVVRLNGALLIHFPLHADSLEETQVSQHVYAAVLFSYLFGVDLSDSAQVQGVVTPIVSLQDPTRCFDPSFAFLKHLFPSWKSVSDDFFTDDLASMFNALFLHRSTFIAAVERVMMRDCLLQGASCKGIPYYVDGMYQRVFEPRDATKDETLFYGPSYARFKQVVQHAFQ